MNPAAIPLAMVPVAWVLPNHHMPWLSAWQEGLAIALLVLAALLSRHRTAIPGLWMAAAGLALGSVVAQAIAGKIMFAGDALMAGYYVLIFILGIAVGQSALVTALPTATAPAEAPAVDDAALTAISCGTVIGAVLCVATALGQWAGVPLLPLVQVDLPPGARPFSNLAQPNNFSTAAFLGVTALALLREGRRIGAVGFWVGAAFMLLGMMMSGSRIAWVHLALAVAVVAGLRGRARIMVGVGSTALLVVLALMVQVAFSHLDDLYGQGGDRPLEEKLSAGARPALWREMLASISKEPIWGHGWQQVGAAQQSVALDRAPNPAFLHHIDHAHSIALDLVVWAGLPVGGLILLLCAAALWRHLRQVSDARAAWLLIGVLALVAHGLVELPLEFAYFLVPLGVSLGMIAALSGRVGRALNLPTWGVPVGGAALGVALVLVAVDYIRAEEGLRVARLELARIGHVRADPEPVDLLLLDNLEAYLWFIRTEARPKMPPADLLAMGQVAARYGFAPVLFRYALALGFNGRPAEAARTLKLLCHIHSRKRCEEARAAWPGLQERHQALRAVEAP